MTNVEQAIEEAARERLDQWVSRHVKRRAGVTVALSTGVVDEAICRYADECGASVIVIATHGRKGLSHMVLGSVAERVVRGAPCPVLVIKPPKAAVAEPGKGRKATKRAPARTKK
jgi:universal stress protein A